MIRSNIARKISVAFLSTVMLFALVAPDDSHAAKRHKSAQRSGGKVKVDKGSGETSKERDRRLLRECKGRPNSGACMGYTG